MRDEWNYNYDKNNPLLTLTPGQLRAVQIITLMLVERFYSGYEPPPETLN